MPGVESSKPYIITSQSHSLLSAVSWKEHYALIIMVNENLN